MPKPATLAAEAQPLPELPADPFWALAEQIRAVQSEHTLATAPSAPRAASDEPAPVVQSTGLAKLAAALGALEPPANRLLAAPDAPAAPAALASPVEDRISAKAPTAIPAVPAPALLAAAHSEPTPGQALLWGTKPEPKDASRFENPPSGSWLALASFLEYLPLADRPILPAIGRRQAKGADTGPRFTLPGPALPPQLMSFKDPALRVMSDRAGRKGRGPMPGWVAALGVMLALLLAGVSAASYFLPATHPTAEAKVSPPAATPAPQAAPVQVVSHPLSQSIEVTGIRMVVDFNKKSEIRYLVVNHSAGKLSDMTVYVTLRSADSKPGQTPVSRFSFRVPNLGPFESKEMSSPIEKMTGPVMLPEWSDLRAELQIAP